VLVHKIVSSVEVTNLAEPMVSQHFNVSGREPNLAVSQRMTGT
jgi:hypothetical protein